MKTRKDKVIIALTLITIALCSYVAATILQDEQDMTMRSVNH